jgi:hypothetical protein
MYKFFYILRGISVAAMLLLAGAIFLVIFGVPVPFLT